MKIPTILLSAAALGIISCDTVPPAAGPAGPVAGVTVTTANKAPYGSYLVDGAGRALYILEGTRGAPGTQQCGEDCRAVWPSLMALNPPVGGPAINAAQLSTRPAYGGTQVTYSGWPLYYYVRDTGPGDTTGQHVVDRWGAWHLLSPSGEPIRPAGSHH
jgi:predicted lipoprotein with Yx(FWY)xxD motif